MVLIRAIVICHVLWIPQKCSFFLASLSTTGLKKPSRGKITSCESILLKAPPSWPVLLFRMQWRNASGIENPCLWKWLGGSVHALRSMTFNTCSTLVLRWYTLQIFFDISLTKEIFCVLWPVLLRGWRCFCNCGILLKKVSFVTCHFCFPLKPMNIWKNVWSNRSLL